MRNTNLEPVLFPVSLQPLFLLKQDEPLLDFLAVVGRFENRSNVFSVVTKDYHLISNTDAIDLGKKAFKRLFSNSIDIDSDFKIFNVIYPKTKSTATIDIIHKDFKLNVWKKDIYIPYFRLINSYNRTRALTFDIGFCRKLCDNGVIFESNLVNVKIYHQRRSFNPDKLFEVLNAARFITLIEEFRFHLDETKEVKIEKKYFIATIAKSLQLKFELNSTNKQIKSKALKDLGLFISQITPLASKYFSEFGSNAYAVFNTITDYSSNVAEGEENYWQRRNRIVRNQRLAGAWLKNFHNDITRLKYDFTEYLKDYNSFLPYSFN